MIKMRLSFAAANGRFRPTHCHHHTTLGTCPHVVPSSAAAHSSRAPKPTTNAITLGGVTFHFTFFGRGMDPSSITDFKGVVGVADVRGKGRARNPDGSVETLLFDTDMRFMKGVYVGQDGAVHRGTFGFV